MPGTLFKYPRNGASREFILILDALENLIGAVHVHYDRLQLTAREYLAQPDGQAEEDRIRVTMFADAGGLIGTVQRIRLLARRIPGDERTKLAKRAFEAIASAAELARHHLEHIDGAIGPSAAIGIGALGSVSWWFVQPNGKKGCMALISWSFPSESPKASLVAPASIRGDVDHFTTLVGGQFIDITALYDAVVRFQERLIEWCDIQASNGWPILAVHERLRSDGPALT